MQHTDFFAELKQRGKSEDVITLAKQVLDRFDRYQATVPDNPQVVRDFAHQQVAGGDNARSQLVILFWYHDFIKDNASSTYLLTLLGTLDVLESQKQRMASLYGEGKAEAVFNATQIPPLGTDLIHFPKAIVQYLQNMAANLSEVDCQRVLAGNHHGVDVKHFEDDKKLFADELNLENYLRAKHQRLIAELQTYAESGELWYEQHITQAVVDFVKDHQEIQTGILEGKRVIVAKIPYNPDAWLNEENPLRKRYHACHCPFVREAILSETAVPSLWCYCSGGFTKLFFDYLFETDLKVELLESVLDGADCCRFAVTLPQDYKVKYNDEDYHE